MKLIKRILVRLFNLKSQSKGMKPIIRMETLKIELKETVKAYDAKISVAEAEYRSAVLLYENAYSKVSEVHTRYRNKLVTEIVLKDEQDKLKPIEDVVREIGYELDTLKQYKDEEILRIVGKMDSMKDSYVQAKAEEVKARAYQIQMLKLQQLQKVSELRNDYSEVLDADNLMFNHLKQAGISYTKTMADKLSIQTEDVPLTGGDIALPETLVIGVMTGAAMPFDLHLLVEEGKKLKHIK